SVSRAAIEECHENVEKLRPKLDTAKAKYDAKLQAWAEEQTKAGNKDLTRVPVFPEYDDYVKAQSEVIAAEKAVFSEVVLLREALDANGALVAKLPADAQAAIRAEWTKTRLAVKDWAPRAECY